MGSLQPFGVSLDVLELLEAWTRCAEMRQSAMCGQPPHSLIVEVSCTCL